MLIKNNARVCVCIVCMRVCVCVQACTTEEIDTQAERDNGRATTAHTVVPLLLSVTITEAFPACWYFDTVHFYATNSAESSDNITGTPS